MVTDLGRPADLDPPSGGLARPRPLPAPPPKIFPRRLLVQWRCKRTPVYPSVVCMSNGKYPYRYAAFGYTIVSFTPVRPLVAIARRMCYSSAMTNPLKLAHAQALLLTIPNSYDLTLAQDGWQLGFRGSHVQSPPCLTPDEAIVTGVQALLEDWRQENALFGRLARHNESRIEAGLKPHSPQELREQEAAAPVVKSTVSEADVIQITRASAGTAQQGPEY